jgi:hypothetical protein
VQWGAVVHGQTIASLVYFGKRCFFNRSALLFLIHQLYIEAIKQSYGFMAAKACCRDLIVEYIYIVVFRFTKIGFFQIGFHKQTMGKVAEGKIGFSKVAIAKIHIVNPAVLQLQFPQVEPKKRGVINNAFREFKRGGKIKTRPISFGPIYANQFALIKNDIHKFAVIHFDITEITIGKNTFHKFAFIKTCGRKIGVFKITVFKNNSAIGCSRRV